MCGRGDKNDADFVAFAPNAHFLGFGVYLVPIEGYDFTNAQSGGEEEFEKSAIAKRANRIALWRGEEALGFLGGEKFDTALGDFGDGEFFGGKGGNVAKGEEFEECSQGDNGVGLCGEREGLAFLVGATVEFFAVVRYGCDGNLFDGADVFGCKKIAQGMVIIAEGELTSAFFEFEMVEKFSKRLIGVHEGKYSMGAGKLEF